MGAEFEIEFVGPSADTRVRADATAEVTLGRSASCDVTIPSASASSVHAKLRLREGCVEIVDAASRWGTFVGEARADEWTPVSGDAPVWLGDCELRVRAIFPARPTVVRFATGHHTVRLSLLGGPTDTVDAAALGPGFDSLGTTLPLRFERAAGDVVAVVGADGARTALPARIAGVALAIEADEFALESVALPARPVTPHTPSAVSGALNDGSADDLPTPPSRGGADVPDAPPEPGSDAATQPPERRTGWREVTIAVVALSGLAFGALTLWWVLH